MTFHVGQKVVCVGTFGPAGRPADEVPPKRDAVYTIRSIEVRDNGEFVRLREIVNPPRQYSDGWCECCYLSAGFRPVVERKTNIEIFKKMLTGAPNELERAE